MNPIEQEWKPFLIQQKEMEKQETKLGEMRFVLVILWSAVFIYFLVGILMFSGQSFSSMSANNLSILQYILSFGNFLPTVAMISSLFYFFRKSSYNKKKEYFIMNQTIQELKTEISDLKKQLAGKTS